ncbi:hypothetical protein ACG04R_08145 [Roseateles sp. BYS78W]|uniref:Uncharacterized protein n=1 Tax=Pelomonas candidula TaxID=3299025 RepID=A0ABW7H9P6_9BURK
MTASYNQILLAAWRQSNTDGSRWFRIVFYSVVLVGLAVAVWFMPVMQMRIALVCAVLVFALFGLWVLLLVSLLEQNHPTTTRLVPGQLRRLRQAALVAWLLISGAQGVLVWLILAERVPLAPLLLAAAAAGVGVAWTQRHWIWAIVLYTGPSLITPLHLQQRLAPLWHALVDVWQLQPWAWLALSLVVLGALLTQVFGSGDAAHHAAYERRRRMLRAARNGMTGNRAGIANLGRAGEWFAWPVDAGVSRWLSHLLARAQPTQASVMARAELALHGLQHWLSHSVSMALTLACVVLGGTMTFRLFGISPGAMFKGMAPAIAIGLGIAGFNPGFGLRNMLWHTRREQALLVLLPGMPQGPQLNRAVAFLQLRHFLLAWLATTLLLVGLLMLAGMPSLLSLSIAALPLGILNLTNAPARMRAPTPWATSRPVLGFFLAYSVLWALCAFVDGLVWPLMAASVVLSTVLLARRWRTLSQAPSALPAGRLA